jgi:hypothetical protein
MVGVTGTRCVSTARLRDLIRRQLEGVRHEEFETRLAFLVEFRIKGQAKAQPAIKPEGCGSAPWRGHGSPPGDLDKAWSQAHRRSTGLSAIRLVRVLALVTIEGAVAATLPTTARGR